MLVSNPSFDRAQALAERVEGRPIRFDDWARDPVDATILVSSTAAPHPLMTVAKLEPIMGRRRRHPVFTHHRLGLPRDVEPGARKVDGVYPYDLDCLEIIAAKGLEARKGEAELGEQRALAHARAFGGWLEREALYLGVNGRVSWAEHPCPFDLSNAKLNATRSALFATEAKSIMIARGSVATDD